LGKRGEALNIGQHHPRELLADGRQRYHLGFSSSGLGCGHARTTAAKNDLAATEQNAIAIGELGGAHQATGVDVGAIGAAEINDPEFTDGPGFDQGVPA
jgi:hypothetical protein